MTDRIDRSDFLWDVHSYLNEYVRHADTKAELVVGWTSALIGVLVAGQVQKKLDWTMVGITNATGMGLLVSSFILGFWTVLPRLHTTQLPGFIFWQSIAAHKNKEEFVSSLRNQSNDDLAEHVAGHLFEISKIANAKYTWVRLSIYCAFAGSLLIGLGCMIA